MQLTSWSGTLRRGVPTGTGDHVRHDLVPTHGRGSRSGRPPLPDEPLRKRGPAVALPQLDGPAHDASHDRVRATRPAAWDALSCADVPHQPSSRLYTCMAATPTTTTPHDDGLVPPTRALLVTVAQAAEILSLSRSSIYQLIWTDQLTPIRIGRSVRFSIDQIEQFVEDRSAEGQPRKTTTQ